MPTKRRLVVYSQNQPFFVLGNNLTASAVRVYGPGLPIMNTLPLRPLLRRFSIFSCAVIAIAFCASARAEETPKFSAPEVNDFAKKYVALVDEAVKEQGASDADKLQATMAKIGTLMAEQGPLIDPKITAEERPKFEAFIESTSKKLSPAQ